VRLSGGRVPLVRGHDREQGFCDRVHDSSVRRGADAGLIGD
jgi:hypothetical protein